MKASDVVPFNPESHKKTVEEMHARRESVHERGRRVYAETGRLDPLVDIVGKMRLSHNSLVLDPSGEYCVLPNGIALPIVTGHDGTGSMAENLGHAFNAMNALDGLLGQIRSKFGYNTQIASAMAQDVCDPEHGGHPVVQMAQFETDNRIAEQVRLIVPDGGGGDATEDYQILWAYLALASDLDIVNFYGLKGYFMFMADQICREGTTASEIMKYTGHKLQSDMNMKALCQAVLRKYHTFYLQVGSGGEHDEVTSWWEKRLGKGRVVVVPDAELLAEVQAALIYVSETDQPTQADVVKMLLDGTRTNKRLSKAKAEAVWEWIVSANVPFGTQAKLKAGKILPKPGDRFANYRHAWPIGHPWFDRNVTPDEDGGGSSTPSALPPAGGTGGGLDWSKF